MEMTPMSTPIRHRPTKATLPQVDSQIAAVLADLPRFLTAPLYRRRHTRRGPPSPRPPQAMQGDDRIGNAQHRCTRAVTQLPYGQRNDLLDNLVRPSAHHIVPQLQHLRPGERVSMSPTPTEALRSTWTATTSRTGCCGSSQTAPGPGP